MKQEWWTRKTLFNTGKQRAIFSMTPNFKIIQGDSLSVLPTLPDNSIDSIVTDPPYELGFMNKGWDKSGIANNVNLWKECLRVLKPGGHLLAFSGSRTYHRMTCAIEDAGFEVRDQIMWVYGSGFPKGINVSKAIDKMDAAEARRARQLKFTEWMSGTGMAQSECAALLRPYAKNEETAAAMAQHYFTDKTQPAVPTRQIFESLRTHITCEVPAWVEQMVDERTVESENFKMREVVGEFEGTKVSIAPGQEKELSYTTIKITTPATPLAKQWDGWGTALKPAHEPICVARKPLANGNTVADNVVQFGTGAINVDACRVGTENTIRPNGPIGFHGGGSGGSGGSNSGRWPANFVHDGSQGVLDLFPGAEEKSAARFFYCAKASKSDRDEGLDGFEEKDADDTSNFRTLPDQRMDHEQNRLPRKNNHPTVKPTSLMSYLVRLVTPPGGTVLDPFLGSGSTGKACMREGFNFIGIELTPEYIPIATARIENERKKSGQEGTVQDELDLE